MFIWQYVDLDPEEVNKIKEKYLSGLPPTHEFYQTLNLGISIRLVTDPWDLVSVG